jgi:hypothetical protein
MYSYISSANSPLSSLSASAKDEEDTLLYKVSTKASTKSIILDLERYTPRSQIVEVHNAFEFAETSGYPFNTFVTVVYNAHKEWTPYTRNEPEIQRMLRRVKESVRHLISDFCRRNGFAFSAIFAQEACPGRGPHVHMLLHLPKDRWSELRDRLTRCLMRSMRMSIKEFQQKKREKYALPSDQRKSIWLPVWINSIDKLPDQALCYDDALTKLRYICKSVNPNEPLAYKDDLRTLQEIGDVKLEDTGNARTLRRLTSTNNLGKQARSKAGWADDPHLTFLSAKARSER